MIQILFKEYIVNRKNGQCQVLIPLVELDNLCEKIEKALLKNINAATKDIKPNPVYKRLLDADLGTKEFPLRMYVRAFNCFACADLRTVRKIVQKTPMEMLKLRNMGRKTLFDVIEELKKIGLNLGLSKNQIDMYEKFGSIE